MRVLALLAVTGCGTSITSTTLNQSPKPLLPRSADSVEVFATTLPGRPYVDVAHLEAEQQSDMSLDGTGAFITKLRGRAAEMGCDGVVLGSETNRPTTATVDIVHDVVQILSKEPLDQPEGYGTPSNLRGLTATCIVYVPEPGELERANELADSTYTACKRQRIATLRAMQRATTVDARARLIRTLPTCESPDVLAAKQLNQK
jgi:hypothetical protein